MDHADVLADHGPGGLDAQGGVVEAARVGDDQFVVGVDRLETSLHGLAGDDHEGEFGAADESGLGAACPLQELGRGDAEQPVDLEVVVTGLAVAGVLAGEGAVEVHGDVLELLRAGDGVEAVLQFGGAHGEEVDVLAGQVGNRRLALGGVDEVRHDHRPAGLLGEGAGAVHEALVEATVVGVAGAGDAEDHLAVAVDVRLAGDERARRLRLDGVVRRFRGGVVHGRLAGRCGRLTGGLGRGAGIVRIDLGGGGLGARLVGCGLGVLQGGFGRGDCILVALGRGLGQVGCGLCGLGRGKRGCGAGCGRLGVGECLAGVGLGVLGL